MSEEVNGRVRTMVVEAFAPDDDVYQGGDEFLSHLRAEANKGAMRSLFEAAATYQSAPAEGRVGVTRHEWAISVVMPGDDGKNWYAEQIAEECAKARKEAISDVADWLRDRVVDMPDGQRRAIGSMIAQYAEMIDRDVT